MNRRLLLTGADHLTEKQWARLNATLERCDPTNEISAAWSGKERLQLLLNESKPSRIRQLADFPDAAIEANMAETTRLANTIQTWWPASLVAFTEQVTNARTEGGSTASPDKPSGSGAATATWTATNAVSSATSVTRPLTSAT